jgi:hypothetical protein
MKHIETLPYQRCTNHGQIQALEHLASCRYADLGSNRLIATFALSAATYGIATLVNMTFTTCLPTA